MLIFKMFRLSLFVLLFSLLSAFQLHAEELEKWPRDVKVSSGFIAIYQPQIESLEGNILKGRAAIAFHASGNDTPVFGAAWFTAQVNIDRENRLVHYETLGITETRFPDENKQLGKEFSEAIQKGVKKKNLTSSLDELTTALAAVKQEQKQAASLNNDPPDIIYMEKPALLIVINGKTVLQKIEKSDYQAVVNTPYPLFFESKSEKWFLNAADNVWYSAKKVEGPWTYTEEVPGTLVKMVASRAAEKKEGMSTEKSKDTITAENAPAIVVVHNPTELLVSSGKAEFAPLTDDLLFMSNTDSNIFMDVKSQKYYVIISGRWYKADSMDSRWHFVAADKLPKTFGKIPETSTHADIRAFIAGTDEAKEALMDAQIPQTATVKKGKVDIKVSYDGKPEFEAIAGTDLAFAVNCSETVIKAARQFYLVKDAVWYISDSANGPWQVSDHAPAGIAKVPPSSPVYNTKYVYVYDSTPDVVYVGYTPGYAGSYIYGPTIVYGTGYYYSPWITPYYYYPRPVTWGFSVSYNPWTGWGFGMSWSQGSFHVGFYTGGGYHGSYWGGHRYFGPRGYRTSYNTIHIDNVNINRSRNVTNISNRTNIYRNSSQRATIQNTINSRSISQSERQNMQNKLAANKGGAALSAAGGAALGAAAVNSSSRANNVMVDKSGNVLRNSNGQWQERNNGKWQNRSTTEKTTAARSTAKQYSSGYNKPASIDRQHYSRERATQQRHRTGRSGGRSFGGGGRRH